MQVNSLTGLVRVHAINAQLGFGELDGAEVEGTPAGRSGRRLSEQLRAHYKRYLDPEQSPSPSDLGALRAMDAARLTFDVRPADGFEAAFQGFGALGYSQ